jgi:hypothetical protein
MTEQTLAVLKSEKLTALMETKSKLKDRAVQEQATVVRVSKALSPQFVDVTVTRILDQKDFLRRKSGVVSTGPNEQEEAARKADILARTLAGDSLTGTGLKEQLDQANRNWAAIEDAIEHVDRQIYLERNALSKEYCKKVKPKYVDLITRLAKPMLELQTICGELNGLKRHLLDGEVGLHDIFQMKLPEFLTTSNSAHGEMFELFKDLKRAGYCK